MEIIKTPPASKKYRDNFDRVFKKREELDLAMFPLRSYLQNMNRPFENGNTTVLIKSLDGNDLHLGVE